MATTTLTDTGYVGVGLAVLAVRQATDTAAQLEKRLTERNDRVAKGIEQIRDRAAAFRTQVEEVVAPYTERIQTQLDSFISRLPEQAQKTWKDAVEAGKQFADSFETFTRSVTGTEPVKTAPKKASTAKATTAA